jgi:hypothetical protein
MNEAAKQNWPNLDKDQRAMELAKVALDWSELTIDDQTTQLSRLIELAQIYKNQI